VAALAGSAAGSLVSMVANLAFSTKKLANSREENDAVAAAAQDLKDRLLLKIDEDAASFNAVLAARRLPKKNDEQKTVRENAIAAAVRTATEMPLSVMKLAKEAAELGVAAAGICNPSSATDAGCAGHMAVAAARCAWLNVAVNLADIQDQALAESIKKQADTFLQEILEVNKKLQQKIEAYR